MGCTGWKQPGCGRWSKKSRWQSELRWKLIEQLQMQGSSRSTETGACPLQNLHCHPVISRHTRISSVLALRLKVLVCGNAFAAAIGASCFEEFSEKSHIFLWPLNRLLKCCLHVSQCTVMSSSRACSFSIIANVTGRHSLHCCRSCGQDKFHIDCSKL